MNERLMKIAEAARYQMPSIVPIYEFLGNNGQWYRAGGFPQGVMPSGEHRIAGYVMRASDGCTFGKAEATAEAVKARWDDSQNKKVEEFYKQLLQMPEEKIKEQEKYWLKK